MTKTMSLLTAAALIAGAGTVSQLHAGEPFEPVIGQGVFTGGYDEGLACHYYITDKINAYGSLGFYINGKTGDQNIAADTSDIRPYTSKFRIKAGGEYQLIQKDRFMVNGFGEYKVRLDQGTVKMTSTSVVPGQYWRYNQWSNGFSLGVKPSVFILPQLSIDYKLGLHFIHHGNTYVENADKTGLTKAGNDHNEFGVYSKSEPLWFEDSESMGRFSPLFNLSITYYLKF